MTKAFKPYNDLWSSAHKFKEGIKQWMNDDFTSINAEEAEKVVEEGAKNL